jgi:ribosome assembly protein RRB1
LVKHKELAKKRRLEKEEEPAGDVASSDDDFRFEESNVDSWETDNSAEENKGSDEEENWDDFKALKLVDDEGTIRLQVDPNYVEVEEESKEKPHEAWRGDARRLKPDEELVYDNKAYEVFYRTNVEWPCLSIDLLPGGPEAISYNFPYTIGAVAGC